MYINQNKVKYKFFHYQILYIQKKENKNRILKVQLYVKNFTVFMKLKPLITAHNFFFFINIIKCLGMNSNGIQEQFCPVDHWSCIPDIEQCNHLVWFETPDRNITGLSIASPLRVYKNKFIKKLQNWQKIKCMRTWDR